MASGIKGITVKIGGDTTELGKSLSDAQKKSTALQKELKGVNTLLKNETGVKNVELLKQKQELLTKSIAETKTKLESLKEIQAKADNGEIEMTEEEYRNLQREIASTEQKLQSLINEQKQFGSVGAQQVAAYGEKLKDVGSSITDVGKKLSVVSTATGTLMAGSVSSMKSLKDGYDAIAKGTGATGEQLEDLKNIASDVYSNMATDMDTVGTGLADINTRFGFTGDVLESATEDFIKFADVNNTDVSTAIANVSRYMGDAGIESSNYAEVLDTLTKASQNSGISVDKLSESLTKYGAPMRALGFDTQESIAIFSQWEKAGVNTEIAFSGMKTAISNWSAEGKDAREEFKKTLQEIKNCPDIASATTKAIEVFGKKAGPDLADAIQGGRFEYEDFLAILKDSQGTLSDTYEATQDGTDKATIAMNNLRLAGSELGTAILTSLQPMITGVVDKLKDLTDKFRNLSPQTQQMIVIILAVVTAMGPLLIIIGKLVSSVGSIMTMAPQIQSAFTGISAAIGGISAPILAVVAVIAVLVGAFITLWNTNEEFRNTITGIWSGITETLSGFFQGITDRLNALGFEFSNFGEVVSTVWNGLCSILAPVFEGAFQQVANIFTMVTGVITGLLDIFIGLFTGNWDQCWSGISGVFGSIWDFIVATFSNYIGVFTGVADAFLSLFGTNWSSLWNSIKSFFVGIWNGITSIFTSVTSTIMSVASAAWNGIKTVTSTVWNAIKTAITTPINAAKSLVTSVFNGIKSSASSVWNSIKGTTTSVWNGIKSAITSPINAAKGIFTSAISAMRGALNFSWRLPHLSIPHISVSGGKAPYGIGGLGSLPHFSVQWYKKAMDKAYMFTSPTVLPTASGMKGFGDAGSELVIGNNTLMSMIKSAMSSGSNAEAIVAKLDQIESKLTTLDIVLDSGELVGGIRDKVDTALNDKYDRTVRGW